MLFMGFADLPIKPRLTWRPSLAATTLLFSRRVDTVAELHSWYQSIVSLLALLLYFLILSRR